MKEIKYFCDGENCKKELNQGDMYYIVEINQHIPNMSYNDISPILKHYCKDCFKY